MPSDRTYRVLAVSGGEHVPDQTNPTLVDLVDLGVHNGHNAKAAIEAALAAVGLSTGVKVCAAVPTNNWSECDVAPDPHPQFKVTPRREQAGAMPPAGVSG